MTIKRNKVIIALVALFAALSLVLVATPEADAGTWNYPYWANYEVLNNGDVGQSAVVAQIFLKRYGYYNGPIDGYYGSGSASAARAYQRAHGLYVDGVIGPATWDNLQGDAEYRYHTDLRDSYRISKATCLGTSPHPDDDDHGAKCYWGHYSHPAGGYRVTSYWNGNGWAFWNFEDKCWTMAEPWLKSCR